MTSLFCLQLALGTIMTPQEQTSVISAAQSCLNEAPVTIVAFPAKGSAGGVHDYYSEGDYWWPDPAGTNLPYQKHDGLTNPENFVAHREAVMRFSVTVSTLVAGYKLTGDQTFARQAFRHLNAWFVDPDTRMTPSLLYAQAIKGRVTGRGIGIIDTIHLIEVAQSIRVLIRSGAITNAETEPILAWFRQYLDWMTRHEYGKQEREALNNHGTWWVAQAAAFASLVGDAAVLDSCRERFRDFLLPRQLQPDGSFPLELERTKPFGYSLFNLEGMAVVCRLLTRPGDDLWAYTLPDGRTIRAAFNFLSPFVRDKSRWPHPKDVKYFDLLPVRQMAWLFAADAFNDAGYMALWKRLDPRQGEGEIARTFPIRQPSLWFE
jgi:hypothetical protein